MTLFVIKLKWLFFFIFLTFFLFFLFFYAFISFFFPLSLPSNSSDIEDINCKEYKDFILAFMNPYIYNALKDHFGYEKNFDLFQTEIKDIIDGTYMGYYFDIILVVTSYQGAHLSDFSENTLTFRLDDRGITLLRFY